MVSPRFRVFYFGFGWLFRILDRLIPRYIVVHGRSDGQSCKPEPPKPVLSRLSSNQSCKHTNQSGFSCVQRHVQPETASLLSLNSPARSLQALVCPWISFSFGLFLFCTESTCNSHCVIGPSNLCVGCPMKSPSKSPAFIANSENSSIRDIQPTKSYSFHT